MFAYRYNPTPVKSLPVKTAPVKKPAGNWRGNFEDKQQRLFEILARAAKHGEPCPSNDDLRHKLDYKSHSSPARAMKALEECGLISVERFHTSRIVTIVATGERTG